MKEHDSHRFRPGVQTSTCRSAVSLSDFISDLISDPITAPTPSGLTPLELIELGSVYVNGERCLNPSRILQPGDPIRVHTSPRRFTRPMDLSSRIISESEDTLLVKKPAGLPAEPMVDNIRENLLSFLEDLRGQSLFLTHKLAAESEGLMLIAKSHKALLKIREAFATGQVSRVYVAYVEAFVATGQHSIFEILNCHEQKASTSIITEGGSTWKIPSGELHRCYRVEIESTLARPREIREALGKLGSPVIGDRACHSHYDLHDADTGKTAIAFVTKSISVRPR